MRVGCGVVMGFEAGFEEEHPMLSFVRGSWKLI
jgi:hypothetical protein